MHLTLRSAGFGLAIGLATSFATVMTLGCGSRSGSGGYKPAQVFDGAAGADGAGATAPLPDGSSALLDGVNAGTGGAVVANDASSTSDGPSGAGGADASSSSDAAPAAGGAPGAVPGARLYTGTAQILDRGPTCTTEAGATGDRWCAFLALSVSAPGNVDLYVVDVSRAAAGTEITCGLASDPGCLRLTDSFVEDDLHTALFLGDTLVYYDMSSTPYGWRPGMAAGRALAAAAGDVLACTPAGKGTAVFCLRDLADQPDPTLIQSDILLGRVDGAAEPPLERVETVISANMADDVPRFAIDFLAPEGEYLAWSSRATATGPEILKAQRVGDAASRLTVATDAHSWGTTADLSRWLWLSALDTTAGTGSLDAAPFPAGGTPALLAAGVAQYAAAPGGVVMLTADGVLSAIADPAAAAPRATRLDSAVIGFIALSPQGHVAYAKDFIDGSPQLIDLWVRKMDGSGTPCIPAQTPSAAVSPMVFTPSSGGLIWARLAGNAFDGMYTRTADCNLATLARGISGFDERADGAVLYIDQVLAANGTGSLRFRSVAAGGALGATPNLISAGVGTFSVAPAGPTGGALYSVNAGSNADGMYLRLFP